jgi:hypothetical protein
MEEKNEAQVVGEYASYPEGFEKLVKELDFPVENEAVKRMLLSFTVSSLLHY